MALVKIIILERGASNMTEQRKKKYFNPGEKADISGQYINIKTKREVTVTKGEPFPPTPEKGQKYRLVDRTKHKN